MKKLTIVTLFTLCLSGILSCKKNYECECTYKDQYGGGLTSETGKRTKKDAQAWCDYKEDQINNEETMYDGHCVLK